MGDSDSPNEGAQAATFSPSPVWRIRPRAVQEQRVWALMCGLEIPGKEISSRLKFAARNYLPGCSRMLQRKCRRPANGLLISKLDFELFPPRSKEEASCVPLNVIAFPRSSPRPISRASIVLASRAASSNGTNSVSGSPSVLVYSFCEKPTISIPADPPAAF
jgi:hypothetical protein